MIYQLLKKFDQKHPFELAMAFSVNSDEAYREDKVQDKTAQQNQLKASQEKLSAVKS